MLAQAFTIALLNLAIHTLMSEGYVLHGLNIAFSNFTDKVFGLKVAAIIQEPLYQCYVCMSSFWTFVWCIVFDFHPWYYLPVLALLVCGFSFLIEKLINGERDAD